MSQKSCHSSLLLLVSQAELRPPPQKLGEGKLDKMSYTLLSFSSMTVSLLAGKTQTPAPLQAHSVKRSMLPFWTQP